MDIELISGDDKLFELTFTRNGVIVDITGWIVYFTLKKSRTELNGTALLRKEITTHSDPLHGKTQILISNTETSALQEGICVYSIKIKDANARIVTVLTGQVTITRL